MIAPLSFSLLGSVHIEQGETPLTGFVSNKALALFIYLAVTRRVHTRHHLAALFWDNLSDTDAAANLRITLWNLRRIVDPYLDITRTTVAFNLQSPHTLDVTEFEQRAAPLVHLPNLSPTQVEELAHAVRQYQGDFLQGFHVRDAEEFETWALLQRERLRQMALDTLSALVTHEKNSKIWGRGIEHAKQLLALEPWQEQAHRQLMELYARSGNQNAAFAQYDTCRQILDAELGATLSVETVALYEQLLRGEFTEKSSAAAQDNTPRHNLPFTPTPFFGRRTEIERVKQKILDPAYHLVTLLGEGGIGKTRLSIAVAQELISEFPDGVWFVPLAGVETDEPDIPDALAQAIARALALTYDDKRDLETQLFDHLRSRELLLVLDNLEHLSTGTAWVGTLLQHAPHVSIIATSRTRLMLQAEYALRLEGLPIPKDSTDADAINYSSVQLFLERADRIGGDLDWETDHVEIVKICRLVNGLPLAIELAATQIHHATPAEIAQAIQSNSDNLHTTIRDVPTRHQSMRAVFEYSWQQLPHEQRTLFAQLSVFRGSFTRQAAAAVSELPSAAIQLATLHDQSLVRQVGRGRYQVHELLRQYGAETLHARGAEAQTLARHSAYYCGLLETAGTALKNAQQEEMLQTLQRERNNFIAGWNWAAQNHAQDLIARALEGLYLFFEIQSQVREGEALLETAQAQLEHAPEVSPVLRARLLTRRAHFNIHMEHFEHARLQIQTGLELLDDAAGTERAMLWYESGMLCLSRGDYAEAQTYLMRALDEYEKHADIWGSSQTLLSRSFLAMRVNDLSKARSCANAALEHQRTSGETWTMARTLHTIGTIEIAMGDYDRAAHHFVECITLREKLGDLFGLANTLNNLGDVEYRRGNPAQAREWYQKTLALATQIEKRYVMISALQSLGTIAIQLGEYEQAANYRTAYIPLIAEIQDQFAADCDILLQAQLLHAQGEPMRALELIQPFLENPQTDPWLRHEAQTLNQQIAMNA